MATHSSILVLEESQGFLRILGGAWQATVFGVKRVRHNLETEQPPFVNQGHIFPPFVLHLRNLL